jgi:AraC family transcriptional regulator, regulatory protein of adaptative response / methylated-DNA-[protein]-cysteine methyltransferase
MLNALQNPPTTDQERWEVFMTKDRRYDGAFVVAVRTTGIYCRPSCPSRTPHRENVVFYAVPQEAEDAGFRPCKRCTPDTQAFEAEVVGRICRYMDEHLDAHLTLDDLGNVAALSPHHLQRVFKRALGITPRQYVEARRLEHLKGRLKAGESVTSALYEAGYSSSSRLYERDQLGMTPAVYRKGGKDMHIHFTTAVCSLGVVLVGATEKGICAVSLGDTPAELEATLRRDYPAADIQPDDAGLGEWVAPLLCHLEGEQPHLELPLDIQATAFQWRVWQALRAIPYGETRTYSQIAQAIGSPKAVRAVGTACASNHVAVVIPCHRVVREDGALGGYRWGVARKEKLLRREQS